MLTDSTTHLCVEIVGVDTEVEKRGATGEARATDGRDGFPIDGQTVHHVLRIEGFKCGHFMTGAKQS